MFVTKYQYYFDDETIKEFYELKSKFIGDYYWRFFIKEVFYCTNIIFDENTDDFDNFTIMYIVKRISDYALRNYCVIFNEQLIYDRLLEFLKKEGCINVLD